MKSFTWIDLRHCQRRTADERQRPTHYGYFSSVATAFFLEEKRLTPEYWLTSEQPRAVQFGRLILQTLEIELPTRALPSLNHLRTDLGTEHYLRFIHEVEAAGATSKFRALQTPWIRQRLFDRSTVAFDEVGQWLNNNASNNTVLLVTGHGYAVAMRYLRMKQLSGDVQLTAQLSKKIGPEEFGGEMFVHCEGGIYRDLKVDAAGKIVGCANVEPFRLPPELKSCETVFK